MSAAPIIGIGLISTVMTIMLFPAAGLRRYTDYKPPLFMGGVIFMPLFIFIAVILRAPLSLEAKTSLLLLGLVGFWASAAWLGLKDTQGEYVPGLELRPGMPFRPDLILPGGVNYVKGTILTGLGLMLMFQPEYRLPVWSWWGFVLAFWGIITIIPVRGMVKMLLGRRRRFLGEGGTDVGFAVFRGTLLFVGLLILMYGFLNAFMGRVPFVDLLPKGERAPVAVVLIVLAYLILLGRELYKRRLEEGAETTGEMVIKQLWLWAGTLSLIYGYITLFMGRFMVPHPATNPRGFAIGLVLVVAGVALILPVRISALRNEFRATIRIMIGLLADMPEAERNGMMRRMMGAMAAAPERSRVARVSAMIDGLNRLDQERRERMVKARTEVMAELPSQERRALMRAMDEAMFG